METILANLPMALCLLLGMGLIIVEVFLPGFGLPGVAGIALVGVGTIMAAMHFGTLTAVALLLVIIAVLAVFDIPYAAYNAGGSLINLFLGPATVCLAVTIYAQIDLLKKNLLPILAGCAAGAVTSVLSIWGLCRLFGLDRTLTVSLLPKSVTTPIATAIAEGQGGIVSITVAAVIFTGILGNLCAPALARLFRVKDPVAAGLAIGACSHAMGTARALELGETEGAMSGLAIGLCGLATTILALFFDVLV